VQRTRYIGVLRKLCTKSGILGLAPDTFLEGVNKTGDFPVAGGAYSDVWKGVYKGSDVAIKSIRVFSPNDVQEVKKVRLAL
jgi:hypothetical protein